MNAEAFIEFLRKVAEINPFTYYRDERGRIVGEGRAPKEVFAIIDAAKEALAKLGGARPAGEPLCPHLESEATNA